MRKTFRWLGCLMALATVGWWFFCGSNPGWTKTSVPVKAVEEATGIESVVWKNQFVPGVDFLGAGVLVAVVLIGISFCFRTAPVAPEGGR